MEKEINVKPGERVSICSCGYSKKLPYCDDTHIRINKEYTTSYRSIKLRIISGLETEIGVDSKNWDKEDV